MSFVAEFYGTAGAARSFAEWFMTTNAATASLRCLTDAEIARLAAKAELPTCKLASDMRVAVYHEEQSRRARRDEREQRARDAGLLWTDAGSCRWCDPGALCDCIPF